MNLWSDLLSGKSFRDWMSVRLSGQRIQQGVKLDPFITSMRNAKHISEWLELIDGGDSLELRGGSGNQNSTDLKSAGLLEQEGNLSSLGEKVLAGWKNFDLCNDKDEGEFKRFLVLLGESQSVEVGFYSSALGFWREIRKIVSYQEAVSNPECLYLLSFLNKEENGFNPWSIIRDLKLSFKASGNIDSLKNSISDASTIESENIKQLDTWLRGYATRSKARQQFCLAMELIISGEGIVSDVLLNPDMRAIIDSDKLGELAEIVDTYSNMGLKIAGNIIYYGSPGTGKSYAVNEITKGSDVYKTTFHPEYDYHSFVGGYKPSMVDKRVEYAFVPQIFTNAYVAAWNNIESNDSRKPFYIQIEEINRGNCAEIFGDLFQLLDRKEDGASEYEVDASKELKEYLEKNLLKKGESQGIKEGKIKLPQNLSLIATMNTSDQSLFPMDSAFKRRWDWEYVPINYSDSESQFIIDINGKQYEWLGFLKKVNNQIYEITESHDKKLGNWFVKPAKDKLIDQKTFINKVLFYLWNDVFKDEETTIFFDKDNEKITYEDFFGDEQVVADNLDSLLKNIGLSEASKDDESGKQAE